MARFGGTIDFALDAALEYGILKSNKAINSVGNQVKQAQSGFISSMRESASTAKKAFRNASENRIRNSPGLRDTIRKKREAKYDKLEGAYKKTFGDDAPFDYKTLSGMSREEYANRIGSVDIAKSMFMNRQGQYSPARIATATMVGIGGADMMFGDD